MLLDMDIVRSIVFRKERVSQLIIFIRLVAQHPPVLVAMHGVNSNEELLTTVSSASPLPYRSDTQEFALLRGWINVCKNSARVPDIGVGHREKDLAVSTDRQEVFLVDVSTDGCRFNSVYETNEVGRRHSILVLDRGRTNSANMTSCLPHRRSSAS